MDVKDIMARKRRAEIEITAILIELERDTGLVIQQMKPKRDGLIRGYQTPEITGFAILLQTQLWEVT